MISVRLSDNIQGKSLSDWLDDPNGIHIGDTFCARTTPTIVVYCGNSLFMTLSDDSLGPAPADNFKMSYRKVDLIITVVDS